MADIVLAECRGQAWLVSGEQHIDNLLANRLPPEVTIELVACESKSQVDALWVQHCGPPAPFTAPWLIHPAITNRVRRNHQSGHAVFFAQWSAMIDDEARVVINAAGNWAAENADMNVLLIRYANAGGPQPLLDLAALRATIIQAELVKLGIPAERIKGELRDVTTVPAMGEESQRIDIALKPAH